MIILTLNIFWISIYRGRQRKSNETLCSPFSAYLYYINSNAMEGPYSNSFSRNDNINNLTIKKISRVEVHRTCINRLKSETVLQWSQYVI